MGARATVAPKHLVGGLLVGAPDLRLQRSPVRALCLNPILSPSHRVEKAMLTWLSPVAFAV